MKSTIKIITKALNEIESYAEEIGYEAVVENINLEYEMISFKLRKSEVTYKWENGYNRVWCERDCSYRYSTETFSIGSEETGECIFDNLGYQIGGTFRF